MQSVKYILVRPPILAQLLTPFTQSRTEIPVDFLGLTAVVGVLVGFLGYRAGASRGLAALDGPVPLSLHGSLPSLLFIDLLRCFLHYKFLFFVYFFKIAVQKPLY